MSAVMKSETNRVSADDQEAKWLAVVGRDRRCDGGFVFAVSSTGIYCRPSCPSRRPRRENVSFFALPEAAEQAGYRACRRCHPKTSPSLNPQTQVAQQICRLIEQHDGPIRLEQLSEQIGVSPFHLQRTFKSVMGISPAEYAEACRVQRFKQGLREGETITNAMYDAGYGSSSRLYESAGSELGMTPATYGKGGRGARIRFAVVECSLGQLLVAATDTGVCSVKLGDSKTALTGDLRSEFPAAELTNDQTTLQPWINAVVKYLEFDAPRIDLPLDIRATAFQKLVWKQLRAIPYGETYSYAELAKAIGQEKAVRAVARACATNPVALVIPCHRVIREDKTLGGYRWGLDRKRKLLQAEQAHK